MKRCSKCGETKPIEEYNTHKRRKDGLQSICRMCGKIVAKERHTRRKTEDKAYIKQWRAGYQKVTEDETSKLCTACGFWKSVTDFRKDWPVGLRSQCRDCENKKRRGKQPDAKDVVVNGKTCTRCGEWKAAPEFYRNRHAGDGLTSACRICSKEASRQSKLNNPERKRRLHKPRNPEKKRRYDKDRRDRIRVTKRRDLVNDYTKQDWQEMCLWFGNSCLSCGVTSSLSRDHVIPLVIGGTDTLGNCQPLCLPCNLRKGANIVDYRNHEQLQKFLENLKQRREAWSFVARENVDDEAAVSPLDL